jgi:hypothetical protein
VSVGVDTLTPADLQLHAALGIPPQLLAEAGVRRVTHQEARRDCGIRYKSDHLEGIWYPNHDPESDRIRGGRVRRDHPEVDHQGKPIAKYVAPRGVIGRTTDAAGARVDQKGPLPDLDRIVWRDRDIVICFDANARTNPKVGAARRALAADLAGRGARVRVADLPVGEGRST